VNGKVTVDIKTFFEIGDELDSTDSAALESACPGLGSW
jgi:hypothetical protein